MDTKEKWYLKTGFICILFVFWWLYAIPLFIGIFLLTKKRKRDKLFQQYVNQLKDDNERMHGLMTPEMQDAFLLDTRIATLKQELTELEYKLKGTQNELHGVESNIEKKRKDLIYMDDEILVQEFGLYQPKYDFTNSELYKEKLKTVREAQKLSIKSNAAATGNMAWTVNGSKAQGSKMVRDMQKLLLRAFNSECDELIAKVKYNNYDASLKRITSSRDAISKLGTIMNISISQSYYNLKIDELKIALEYQIKKQEEKEALREAREQMREAAKLQKEIEEQRKKVEKEQSHYENALESILAQLENATDEQREFLLEKKLELEQQLFHIKNTLIDIDYREANQRAGYVYVISNLGSFGENVYKIGMTRRLDPQERVDELGDASVPFNFDVHAMIFTEDAPGLEAALHKAFDDRKLNMVNTRREFFKVSLDEIKEVIKSNFDKTVDFTDTPEANQFRVSQKMKATA